MSDECSMGFCYRNKVPNSNFCERHKETEDYRATVDRLRTELEATQAALTVMTAARDMQLPAMDAVGKRLLKSIADLAAARRQLDEARGLLERWQRWRSDGTMALRLDTDAFLSPAPTFSQLIQQAGELPVTGMAGAETPVPPKCASWCGTTTNWLDDEPCGGKGCWPTEDKVNKLDTCFCTRACRDAGTSQHPEKP